MDTITYPKNYSILSSLNTTGLRPSVQQLTMLPGLLIHRKSPPRARWATSLWMSAQAQLQNPSGMAIPLLRYSFPVSTASHTGFVVSAASSANISPGLSFATTVIFTSVMIIVEKWVKG